MAVRYAQSYIDRLYEMRDIFTLHWVISVVSRDHELPQQFWLFIQLWNWACATRSGVWQYYESISAEEFQRIAQALDRFGLPELAERYRGGMKSWKDPERCLDLDRWIEHHWNKLETAA